MVNWGNGDMKSRWKGGPRINMRIPVIEKLPNSGFKLTHETIQDILDGVAVKYGGKVEKINMQTSSSNTSINMVLNSKKILFQNLSDEDFEKEFFKIFDEKEFASYCDVILREIKQFPPSMDTHDNRVSAIKSGIKGYCKIQRSNICEKEKIPSYEKHKLMLLSQFEERMVKSLQNA